MKYVRLETEHTRSGKLRTIELGRFIKPRYRSDKPRYIQLTRNQFRVITVGSLIYKTSQQFFSNMPTKLIPCGITDLALQSTSKSAIWIHQTNLQLASVEEVIWAWNISNHDLWFISFDTCSGCLVPLWNSPFQGYQKCLLGFLVILGHRISSYFKSKVSFLYGPSPSYKLKLIIQKQSSDFGLLIQVIT